MDASQVLHLIEQIRAEQANFREVPVVVVAAPDGEMIGA